MNRCSTSLNRGTTIPPSYPPDFPLASRAGASRLSFLSVPYRNGNRSLASAYICPHSALRPPLAQLPVPLHGDQQFAHLGGRVDLDVDQPISVLYRPPLLCREHLERRCSDYSIFSRRDSKGTREIGMCLVAPSTERRDGMWGGWHHSVGSPCVPSSIEWLSDRSSVRPSIAC